MSNAVNDGCQTDRVAPVNLTTKLAYGVGEMAGEIPGSLLVFYGLFFLTSVAGLNPDLAGSVFLVAKIWDAANDPLVGGLSDRTQALVSPNCFARWGRRYPWMLMGAVPLGICFVLQWWVLPTQRQWLLFAYYGAIALLFYTAYTMVVVPFVTLAAEITQTYDERTSLIGFKASFSIGSSILALVLAQLVFDRVADVRQQYLILAATCGLLSCLAVYVCVWGTHRRYQVIRAQRDRIERPPAPPLLQQLRIAFSNRPFLIVAGIYLCSWLGLQVTAAILPYFVVDWMGLQDTHFTLMALAVQGTALGTMFFWSTLGQRLGKRVIYCWGIPLTLCAQVGLFWLHPGQTGLMYALGILAGMGLATAYLVPWSMLPDVVDLDELNTGQRREGIFYGLVVQLQKIGVAIALFLVGKILAWSGFIATVADQTATVQSPQPHSALVAIRWLIAPLPSAILIGGLVLAYFYPISRDVHRQILLQLSERRNPQP